MRMLRYVIAVLALCLLPVTAQAASCYWVGGSGNWSDGGNHWASASNGTPGTCSGAGGGAGTHYPNSLASDLAFLDANSGSGTATIDVSGLAVNQLTMTNYPGTLTDAVNNYPLSLVNFVCSAGTSLATLNLGSATWTVTGAGAQAAWGDFGCLATLTASSSTLIFTGASASGQISFTLNGHTYGTISLTAGNTNGHFYSINGGGLPAGTIGTLLVSNGARLQFPGGVNTTFTNAPVLAGSASQLITFSGPNSGGTQATLTIPNSSAATCSYCTFFGIKVNGTSASFTATNSYDEGTNGGGTATLTITNPSGGSSGGFIIGGG